MPNKGIGFGALRYLGSAASQAALAGLPMPRITFNYLGQFDGTSPWTHCSFRPASAGDDQSGRALANWLALNGRIYGGELRIDWSFVASASKPPASSAWPTPIATNCWR